METLNIKKRENKGWANLRPAKKGEVRNPHGRPKKELHIPDLLNKIGDEPCPESLMVGLKKIYPNLGEINHREALQRVAYYYALRGQPWAIQYIADRTDGKPKQTIETKELKPITILTIDGE